MNQPELTNAIKYMALTNESKLSEEMFVSVLRSIIQHEKWIWIAVTDAENGGYAFPVVQIDGKKFIPVFSEQKYVKTGSGVFFMSASIGKVIDGVFQNNGLDGFAINPFTPDCHCCVQKDQIVSILT